MKRLFLIFILMLCSFTSVMAEIANRDSLIRMAEITTDENQRKEIYRNLADIYIEKPEERYYLKLLYQSA